MEIIEQNQIFSEDRRLADNSSPIPPSTGTAGASSSLAFRDAARLYLSKGGERRFLKRLLLQFGALQLNEMTQAWAEAAVRQLYPAATPATQNREFWTPLIAVLNVAADQGLCPRTNLTRPRLEAITSLHFFSPAAAQQIIDNSAPHLARQLRFAICTGAYPSELFELRWEAFDWNAGTVALPSYDAMVPIVLSAAMLDEFVRQRNETDCVFGHYDGRHYAAKKNTGGHNKTALRTAARRAGVERITLTHIRQTWAVWYLSLHGADSLMYAARWSSERSAARYLRLPVDRLRSIRRSLLNDDLEICRLFRDTRWRPDAEAGS